MSYFAGTFDSVFYMLKEILEGPLPVERFELEPSYRLRVWE
jgi:hypothetical protein